ncbi:hypothetical protein [Streptomyces sp. NPDC059639]|uniref:hypothetical protein n=1 Tax=Streptomyces sp. NPDC059639 TaxID=3346891 RepID=UPI0036ABB4C2
MLDAAPGVGTSKGAVAGGTGDAGGAGSASGASGDGASGADGARLDVMGAGTLPGRLRAAGRADAIDPRRVSLGAARRGRPEWKMSGLADHRR